MYPHLCQFNHSCCPNALVFFENDMCIVKAIKTIRKEEEICIPYMDFMNSKWIRNVLLREHNFECDCFRCKEIGEWRVLLRDFEGFRCPKC